MAKKKNLKPLDAGVDRIYLAARRGVQNRENASATKNHIRKLVTETDPTNLKMIAKHEEVKNLLESEKAINEGLTIANKDLALQLEHATTNLSLADGTVAKLTVDKEELQKNQGDLEETIRFQREEKQQLEKVNTKLQEDVDKVTSELIDLKRTLDPKPADESKDSPADEVKESKKGKKSNEAAGSGDSPAGK